jgi:hypothetical protein
MIDKTTILKILITGFRTSVSDETPLLTKEKMKLKAKQSKANKCER